MNGAFDVQGLGGAIAVAITPDGKHAYAVGNGDDTVVAFRVQVGGGRLDFVETESVNDAISLAISSDSQNVYVAGSQENSLTVFRRVEQTGELDFVQKLDDGIGLDGLSLVNSVATSPDGHSVYTAAIGDDAVAVFRRTNSNGALTFLEAHRDGENGVDGLNRATDVAVSPDGRNVYATGETDNAVAVFERDPSNGRLDILEVQREGSLGVHGLRGAKAVAVSPNGEAVYVAASASFNGALAVFRRDPETGSLTFEHTELDGVAGVEGLAGASDVAVSAPTGSDVYVTGRQDHAVVHFQAVQQGTAVTFP
jgi:6-phosphogluconolactonase (cycloisomerase 2 family)